MASVTLPTYRMRAVHLTAVWAYAVSQPVFALLQGNPEFLVLRGFTRIEVIAFAVSLALAPPLLAVACEWLLAFVWRWGANVLHVLFLFAFLVPLALQVAKWIDPTTADVALLVVFVISTGGAAVYLVWRPARLFLSFSLVLPIFGLVSFVLGVPVATTDAEAADVHAAFRPPVVMVVLDELPVSSLMTHSGDIDAVRYPNFARLARDGTWYRNATTVHDFSSEAVPAILTGRRSEHGSLATAAEHPQNLFTLLGGSYELRVHESWTRLCPLRLCPQGFRDTLRGVDDLYEDVGVAYLHKVVPGTLSAPVPPTFAGYDNEAFGELLEEISSGGDAGVLHFAHLLLPHAPWRLLPSGRSYYFSELTEGLLYPGGMWTVNSSLVDQAYQRHLLQLGYTDTLLGRLLHELEQERLYDQALVIVVADHGASFRPGVARRSVSRETLADIGAVPLIVKYPHQRRTGPDSRPARTIDILPTIADVLGIRLPWRVEGRSLLEAPSGRDQVTVQGTFATVRGSMEWVSKNVDATTHRKAKLFGEGDDSLFRLGVHKRFLGARVGPDLPRSTTTRVRIQGGELFGDVRRGSSVVPARIAGLVVAGELPRGTELAIALNGTVVALGKSFRAAGGQLFRVLVPPTALREGHNRIDVFAIEDDGSTPRLVWLGTSAGPG